MSLRRNTLTTYYYAGQSVRLAFSDQGTTVELKHNEHWTPLADVLNGLGAEARERVRAATDKHLRTHTNDVAHLDDTGFAVVIDGED